MTANLASQDLRNRGIALLLLTTLVWGTSFPLLKGMLDSLSPPVILAARFTIAAIAFSPWLRKLNTNLLRDGILLGLLYFSGCAGALFGLQTISANRSAFIVSLNVVLVPLLGALLGQRLNPRVVVAALLSVTGIGVMSWEGGGLRQGDFLTFGTAIGITIYILKLEVTTARYATLPFTAIQLLVMSLLSITWASPDLIDQIDAIRSHFNVLLFLGVVVTAVPVLTQALAQRWVPAQETALLYTTEPVFAALFSFVLLGEELGARGVLGAGIVLTAMILSQTQKDDRIHHR